MIFGAHCSGGVTMPSPYSSSGTRGDARRLARNLGIDFLPGAFGYDGDLAPHADVERIRAIFVARENPREAVALVVFEQDDLIAAAGANGFSPPTEIRADQIFVRGVRLPFLKFPRSPNL